jgi:tetratricopeptide (TPR) repeat protein
MHISGRVVQLDQQYSLLQRYVLPVAVATAVAVGATGLAAVSTARDSADDSAAALLREGYGLAYNLDHDAAVEALTQAARLVPDEPTAHRGLASIAWLNILFTRGTVTADEYLGKLSRKDVTVSPPPRQVAAAFHEHARRAVSAAERQIERNPRDAQAHYARGSALGLTASYTATIEGRVAAAFPTARRAYKAAERAIEIDPNLHEAKLILGTYRYIVASQSLPTRLVAYVAGMDGDKAKGLALIEESARANTEVQTEARFALVLLYNRERMYDAALRVIGQLQQQYPRNRILWLEAGATSQRAGRHDAAERVLSEGISRLATDTRPRMFGEDALWHYNRGLARASLQRDAAAQGDFIKAVEAKDAREWVRGRAHLELGRVLARQGKATEARWQYEKAVKALERGRDDGPLAEARALLRAGGGK